LTFDIRSITTMSDSPGSIEDDERPIALRRTRRFADSKAHPQTRSSAAFPRPHGITTPPATPKRSQKRVRFSAPGLGNDLEHISSGLTPFIGRTTISTPQSRRCHSTPIRLWNLAPNDPPISGTVQFPPLRQVLDGRVKRRLKRNRLSEETNTIEEHKRNEAKKRRTEIDSLKEALKMKDHEMQSMREQQDLASQIGGESGSPFIMSNTPSTQVQELQQQVVELKAQLARREIDATEDADWTMAAQDPFLFEEDEDDMMITNYSHDFRESMMDDEMMTTPTRLRLSFPSPPTSMPNTPCKALSVHSAGVQTSLPIPDPEKDYLHSQLQSLEVEISKLNSTIALSTDNSSRLHAKLSDFIPTDEEHDQTSVDLALDTVLTQLALSQANALEKKYAFSALSSNVTSLGFSSCSGPEQVLEKIAAQFRQARLDLEYMTPGELVEGFENEKLLDMLVKRMQVLVEMVKKGEDAIDEYHDQELSLRQQLNTRIDVQEQLQGEIGAAKVTIGDLENEVEDKETSNARLQKALEGYRQEVQGLEKLISRMEEERCSNESALKGEVDEISSRLQDEILKHDMTRAAEEGHQILVIELESRLTAALQATADIESQLVILTSSNSIAIANKDAAIEELKCSSLERERQHGDALANRDARVSELRAELGRANEALKTAHSTILDLRKESSALKSQIKGEKTRGHLMRDLESMRDQFNRVLAGMKYINNDAPLMMGDGPTTTISNSVSRPYFRREGSAPAAISTDTRTASIVRLGGGFAGHLARRGSKKRRRHDSGLGFVEEEERADMASPLP